MPDPRATNGTWCSAHARTTAASCVGVLGYDDQGRRDPVVGQPVALVGAQPGPVGDHPVGREQLRAQLGERGDPASLRSVGRCCRQSPSRSSVGLGGEAGALDARHRGRLVVVGGVAGDAHGAEQGAVGVADQDPAGHGHERAADG